METFRSMRFRALFALLPALAVLAPAPALAGPWNLAPGEYYAQIQSARAFTDSYLDADGVRQTRPFVTERNALTTSLELGWKKHVNFLLSAPIVRVTNRQGEIHETATGIGDLGLGFRYGLRNAHDALALELTASLPLGTISAPETFHGDSFQDIGLGTLPGDPGYRRGPHVGIDDGLYEVALGLDYGTAITKHGFVQAYAGLARRMLENAFSSQKDSTESDYVALHRQNQLKLRIEGGGWVWGPVLLTGHYFGIVTLSNGDASPDATAHIVGPEFRYRIDDRLDLLAGSNHTASGHRIDHVDEFYAGVAFRQSKLNRLQGFLGNSHRP